MSASSPHCRRRLRRDPAVSLRRRPSGGVGAQPNIGENHRPAVQRSRAISLAPARDRVRLARLPEMLDRRLARHARRPPRPGQLFTLLAGGCAGYHRTFGEPLARDTRTSPNAGAPRGASTSVLLPRCDPGAGVADLAEYGVSRISRRVPCLRAGAGICRLRRSRGPPMSASNSAVDTSCASERRSFPSRGGPPTQTG